MGQGSEAVLYDIDGSALPVDNGVLTPPETPLLMIGGSDGYYSRYITLDTLGRQLMVGAGTVGSPSGGIITIQGITGGTPLPVQIVNTTTTNTTSVAASATNVTLLSINTSRKGATIWNDSTTATLFVKLGSVASATSYAAQLFPTGYYEVPYGYTGRIDGIWSAAIGNARITELT